MRTPWWFPVTGGDVSVTSGACPAPAIAARFRTVPRSLLRPASDPTLQSGGSEASWR
ncbi:hypothetical protein HMPREF9057_00415 [Actinomyces sp. oral taxon 171 str. F0337]|nr:hypothetical protein HMPREF9057_00415 [Actinomyces sp. oral taxon 171 str. F0337]